MPPKFVNKQTQTNKEIIKNVVIVDRIIAMNYNKICEIPNYAKYSILYVYQKL